MKKSSKEIVPVKQSEVNIGTVGHVDSGKTSIVKTLTGEWADKHSEEIKRGITIRLGYADADIYVCEECKPKCYTTQETCTNGHKAKFVRRISFVDCPGHENLMTVTLSGASLMDGAILVIAANEDCPQPQTREHLNALEISGTKNIVIVQNKIDLVSEERAKENYKEIKEFVKGSIAENAPIIPVAAPYNLNVSALIEALENGIKTPVRDKEKNFKMFVARSFDTNKPGTAIDKIVGGVIGGSIIQGNIKIGEQVEIGPGLESKSGEYKPVITTVKSLSIKQGELETAHPGGLVGIGTELDPNLTKGDRLVGDFVGKPGTLPKAANRIKMDVHLFGKTVNLESIENVKENETLVINMGTATRIGTVSGVRNQEIEVDLKKAICAEKGDKAAISRKIGTRWGLIGYGVIK
jgi:translation initiation factor 2 subunit 3